MSKYYLLYISTIPDLSHEIGFADVEGRGSRFSKGSIYNYRYIIYYQIVCAISNIRYKYVYFN